MTASNQDVADRNQQWLDIWQNKYNHDQVGKDLHVLDGYDGMTAEQWQALTKFAIDKMHITPTDDVLEVGCGCGAFLNEISSFGTLSGIDYSANAVKVAQQHLQGDFRTAEASLLPFKDDSFDVVFSFGVFFYFDSLEYATQAIDEMCRVCRPGGRIFIGEVNDLAKRDVAEAMRAASQDKREAAYVSNSSPDHLYYPKEFFREAAKSRGLQAEFYDEDVPELAFYYNGPYRFSVSLLP